MKELFIRIKFWFYIKWLFIYKKILHKKRTNTMVPVSFVLRIRQIGEFVILVGAIALMFFIAQKFLRG